MWSSSSALCCLSCSIFKCSCCSVAMPLISRDRLKLVADGTCRGLNLDQRTVVLRSPFVQQLPRALVRVRGREHVFPGGHEKALQRAEVVIDRAGLMTGVNHAIRTLRIAALRTVVLPLCRGQQLFEGVGIAILQEIARLLPAEDREGRHAPGGALEVLLAHQKLGEERMGVELPLLLAVGENGAEHPARLGFA